MSESFDFVGATISRRKLLTAASVGFGGALLGLPRDAYANPHPIDGITSRLADVVDMKKEPSLTIHRLPNQTNGAVKIVVPATTYFHHRNLGLTKYQKKGLLTSAADLERGIEHTKVAVARIKATKSPQPFDQTEIKRLEATVYEMQTRQRRIESVIAKLTDNIEREMIKAEQDMLAQQMAFIDKQIAAASVSNSDIPVYADDSAMLFTFMQNVWDAQTFHIMQGLGRSLDAPTLLGLFLAAQKARRVFLATITSAFENKNIGRADYDREIANLPKTVADHVMPIAPNERLTSPTGSFRSSTTDSFPSSKGFVRTGWDNIDHNDETGGEGRLWYDVVDQNGDTIVENKNNRAVISYLKGRGIYNSTPLPKEPRRPFNGTENLSVRFLHV